MAQGRKIGLAEEHQRKTENNKEGVRNPALPDFCLLRRAHWSKCSLSAYQDVPERLQFLKAAAGAERNAGKRILGNRNRQPRGIAQNAIDIAKQRAAAGHDNALLDNVSGKFGRGLLKGHLDPVDNLPDRIRNCFGNLRLGDGDFLGDTIDEVAASHLDLDAGALFRLARHRCFS